MSQEVRQPRPLASEPPRRAADSPYLTAQECAAYLKFRNVGALYDAIGRGLDVPVLRRGRTLLFHRDQLDRWLAGEPRVGILREARRRHQHADSLLKSVTPRKSQQQDNR